MKISSVQEDGRTFNNVPKELIQQFTLDCFLHHKVKLIRNWGSCDDSDQLPYKDVTLLQFATKSCNCRCIIKPREGTIAIGHSTNRGRSLYLYFVKKLQAMIEGTYKPNFE